MLHEATTPSGVVIAFEDGAPDPETGKSHKRRYLVDGEDLVSVTTALGILDKPALLFWAEKLAVVGAVQLANDGGLPQSVDAALSRMKSRELRFFQVRDKKAERGTVTHEELVRLATGGELTDVESFPTEQQGFIRGAADWFADHRPAITEHETMVASVKHGFAGRPDAFGEVPGLGAGSYLLDYKSQESLPRYKDGTVKPPYLENVLQVGAYELARRESGHEPSDLQAIVRIDASGDHHTFATSVDPDPFLAVLGAYKAIRALKSEKLTKKAMAAA